MKIFTARHGSVAEGAKVQIVKLPGAKVEFPAILVGEEGRGSALGVLPMEQAIVPWVNNGELRQPGRLVRASVGGTHSPRLVSERPGEDDRCLVVLMTSPGYRGDCGHTGDRTDVPCPDRGRVGNDHRSRCQTCGLVAPEGTAWADGAWMHPEEGTQKKFGQFPGEVICRGRTSQGDAGRMGGGEQIVAVVKEGVVFRAGRSGRLYGEPSAHYYVFRGGSLLTATWDERVVSDVF